MYIIDFEYKIKGIPCTIKAQIPAHKDDEVVYEVYARGKKQALWLEAKIDDDTHSDILARVQAELDNEEDKYYEYY